MKPTLFWSSNGEIYEDYEEALNAQHRAPPQEDDTIRTEAPQDKDRSS